jgi:hypothetical protein
MPLKTGAEQLKCQTLFAQSPQHSLEHLTLEIP